MEHLKGMRLEGQHREPGAEAPRALGRASDQDLMALVDAVEIADRHHRAAVRGLEHGRVTQDAHGGARYLGLRQKATPSYIYFRRAAVFRAMASRTRALNAASLILSPSLRSIARRALPSRLELKSFAASFS